MSYAGEYDSREWPSGYRVGERYVPASTVQVKTVHAVDCEINREQLKELCSEIEKLNIMLEQNRFFVPLKIYQQWTAIHNRVKELLKNE